MLRSFSYDAKLARPVPGALVAVINVIPTYQEI